MWAKSTVTSSVRHLWLYWYLHRTSWRRHGGSQPATLSTHTVSFPFGTSEGFLSFLEGRLIFGSVNKGYCRPSVLWETGIIAVHVLTVMLLSTWKVCSWVVSVELMTGPYIPLFTSLMTGPSRASCLPRVLRGWYQDPRADFHRAMTILCTQAL